MYWDAKLLNDKGVINQTLTVEQRVLTGSLYIVPDVHALFTRHWLEWMDKCIERYINEVVRELYASYVATLGFSLDRQSKPAKQEPLDHLRVSGRRVEIPLPTICQFLYGTDIGATREILTSDFDYRWRLIKTAFSL